VLFLTGFLALSSCSGVAREFDQGTLEVLLYGPVDGASYVTARYVATTVIYVLLLSVLGLAIVVDSAVTHLDLSGDLLAGAVLSVFTNSAAIAFAIWLATATQRVRAATLTLIGVLILLIGLQLGDGFLSVAAAAAGVDSPLYYLSQAVTFVNNGASWVSPFGYLMRGMNAVDNGQALLFVVSLLLSASFAVAFLVLAILTIRWKGVRR
jgi:ABC-type multidrug transport system permease subunit